jgi:hypothetical protein
MLYSDEGDNDLKLLRKTLPPTIFARIATVVAGRACSLDRVVVAPLEGD